MRRRSGGQRTARLESVALVVAAAMIATAVVIALRMPGAGSGGEPLVSDTRRGAPPEIEVVLGEWDLQVATTSLAPGPVRFTVRNAGRLAHAVRVRSEDDGPRREWRAEPIAPGGSRTFTVDLTAGAYTLDCPIESAHGEHDALGMERELTVRASDDDRVRDP